ncbi:DUF262 domain-containing protein [Thiothrix litoralis]|jgi:hypothetical protein|uniref:DUF262 domain-containing protein n=1 Tax=Thiothrix litoralis TaxID=2891210 RepID=A0ABX7WX74_9GAMM|nr:DUF262 domain-containing protein [Thiothrix litoralis]QTR48274.1 DUF262 domain-containing protein [Thiothrix litoralis]
MNFCELIEKYTITIPMIQRDYAQGRKSAAEGNIRRELLSDVDKNINTGLHLDFIYGSVDEKLLIFTPLDGQQRLTTLFLLHWYVAARNNYLNDNEKNRLTKFRYETRISSTDFIAALVDSIGSITVENTSKKNLSEKIKDCTWFFSSWEHDPTVSAMLVILDAIHEKFCGKIDSLVNINKLTFDFINLDDFKLTDDLYIKMNARGVPLTPFENFKSKFEKLLLSDKLKKETFEENPKKYFLKDYFSNKIETDWVENLWEYVEEKEICDLKYLTIDKSFMRFFWYITEMLYFKSGNFLKSNSGKLKIHNFKYDHDGDPDIDYAVVDEVYDGNLGNIHYLFKILNKIKIIKSLIDGVLSYEHQEGKVSLFTKNFDLLAKVMKTEKGTERIDHQSKLILFAIINYVYHDFDEKKLGDDHLHDLVRVVRNLLVRVRKQSGISFFSDLNDEKMYNCINVMRSLTCDGNVYRILENEPHENFLINNEQLYSIHSEIKKAKLITQYPELREAIFKLEDHLEVKGAIHNFMPEIEESFSSEFIVTFQKRVKAFNEIWSQNCSRIVRGFLVVSNYSTWAGGSSNLGGLWFFGIKNNWNVILAKNTNNENKDFLVKYLSECCKNNLSLDDLINNYINSCDREGELEWKYYFIKYSWMTCAGGRYKNIFAWKNKYGFRVQDFSGIRSSAEHVNPYARTVKSIVNKHIDESKTFSSGNEENPLCLKEDDIKLFCEENGWRVEITDIPTHNNTCFIDCWLITNLPNIQIEAGKAWLKPTEKMDMIEVAVAFICELYQLDNPLDKNKVVDGCAEGVA